MAITLADFNKIWSSTSPLSPYTFSDDNYNEGWNFIGQIPPSRQMWDFLQKNNDEKMQYLANNYLPLSGGTMSDGLVIGFSSTIRKNVDNGSLSLYGGSVYNKGANILLNGQSKSNNPGEFYIYARTESASKVLNGRTDGTLTWDGQPLLPVGIVQAFAGNTIPNGWLLCDGSAVSRTTYANLFACIGTTYGSGDGSTTFNLPNLTDKFIEGSSTVGAEKQAGLPNIKGAISIGQAGVTTWDCLTSKTTGCFVADEPKTSVKLKYTEAASRNASDAAIFDASLSSTIYNDSVDTVQPPALTMRYIIKY